MIGVIDDLLAGHLVLSGPTDEADRVAEQFVVIQSQHAGRQSQFVVRANASAELPGGWVAENISLDELVLAYLREPSATACLARLRFPEAEREGMTVTTTVALPAVVSHDRGSVGRPVSLRRLTRVALIQHRAALVTIFIAFVVFVVAIIIGRDAVSSSYANYLAAGCTLTHPINPGVCANTANQFADIPSFTPLVVALRLFPLVIGAFVGAPLVAREMESGRIGSPGHKEWVEFACSS